MTDCSSRSVWDRDNSERWWREEDAGEDREGAMVSVLDGQTFSGRALTSNSFLRRPQSWRLRVGGSGAQ